MYNFDARNAAVVLPVVLAISSPQWFMPAVLASNIHQVLSSNSLIFITSLFFFFKKKDRVAERVKALVTREDEG